MAYAIDLSGTSGTYFDDRGSEINKATPLYAEVIRTAIDDEQSFRLEMSVWVSQQAKSRGFGTTNIFLFVPDPTPNDPGTADQYRPVLRGTSSMKKNVPNRNTYNNVNPVSAQEFTRGQIEGLIAGSVVTIV